MGWVIYCYITKFKQILYYSLQIEPISTIAQQLSENWTERFTKWSYDTWLQVESSYSLKLQSVQNEIRLTHHDSST